jgi:hypothetical protein
MGYIRRSWLGFDRVEEKTGISMRRLVNPLLWHEYITRTPNTDDNCLPKCEYTITGKGMAEGWLNYYWPQKPNDHLIYEAFVTLDMASEQYASQQQRAS